MVDPWTAPGKNDAQLRCAERVAVDQHRPFHTLTSPKSGVYTLFHLPSQTGADPTASMIASERKGAETPKVQLWNLPALVGKRLQSEAMRRRETPLVHGVITVARPGDVELMRMPRHRSGEAELMLSPWYRPDKVELRLPPWQGPVISS
jgi:hypothetical protein